MSSFGKILRNLRKSNNLTQNQLAQALGLAFSTISMYERGDRQPDFETLEAIADYFNVSMDYLYGKCGDINGSSAPFPTPKICESTTTFPVIGEIAAGYDNIALENWQGDTVEIPNAYLKGRTRDEFFVLSVKGDSMYPDYREGDKVLILKQSTLNFSGQIGAVLYDDEIATLKMVRYAAGEDWMELVPINPNVPPIKIENERLAHCKVLGIPKLLIREMN